MSRERLEKAETSAKGFAVLSKKLSGMLFGMLSILSTQAQASYSDLVEMPKGTTAPLEMGEVVSHDKVISKIKEIKTFIANQLNFVDRKLAFLEAINKAAPLFGSDLDKEKIKEKVILFEGYKMDLESVSLMLDAVANNSPSDDKDSKQSTRSFLLKINLEKILTQLKQESLELLHNE